MFHFGGDQEPIANLAESGHLPISHSRMDDMVLEFQYFFCVFFFLHDDFITAQTVNYLLDFYAGKLNFA